MQKDVGCMQCYEPCFVLTWPLALLCLTADSSFFCHSSGFFCLDFVLSHGSLLLGFCYLDSSFFWHPVCFLNCHVFCLSSGFFYFDSVCLTFVLRLAHKFLLASYLSSELSCFCLSSGFFCLDSVCLTSVLHRAHVLLLASCLSSEMSCFCLSSGFFCLDSVCLTSVLH